jgi:hypothetical protein
MNTDRGLSDINFYLMSLWQSFEWFFSDIQIIIFVYLLTIAPSNNRLSYTIHSTTRIQSPGQCLGLKFEKKKFTNKIFFFLDCISRFIYCLGVLWHLFIYLIFFFSSYLFYWLAKNDIGFSFQYNSLGRNKIKTNINRVCFF